MRSSGRTFAGLEAGDEEEEEEREEEEEEVSFHCTSSSSPSSSPSSSWRTECSTTALAAFAGNHVMDPCVIRAHG